MSTCSSLRGEVGKGKSKACSPVLVRRPSFRTMTGLSRSSRGTVLQSTPDGCDTITSPESSLQPRNRKTFEVLKPTNGSSPRRTSRMPYLFSQYVDLPGSRLSNRTQKQRMSPVNPDWTACSSNIHVDRDVNRAYRRVSNKASTFTFGPNPDLSLIMQGLDNSSAIAEDCPPHRDLCLEAESQPACTQAINHFSRSKYRSSWTHIVHGVPFPRHWAKFRNHSTSSNDDSAIGSNISFSSEQRRPSRP
jgi:hypothetical protein